MKQQYTLDFKRKVVFALINRPASKTVRDIAKEYGVPEPTLYVWQKNKDLTSPEANKTPQPQLENFIKEFENNDIKELQAIVSDLLIKAFEVSKKLQSLVLK